MTQKDTSAISLAPAFSLVVPGNDIAAAQALGLPVILVRVEMQDGTPLFTKDDGLPVVPGVLAPQCLGMLVLSDAGHDTATATGAAWPGLTGQTAPPVLDLSRDDADPARVEQKLAALFQQRLIAVMEHNAQLLGMMATLRSEHEDLGRALRLTESFLLKTVKTTRWLTQAHGPLQQNKDGQFSLGPGETLRQRLSASSAGLSDIGIYLPDQALPSSGRLRVRLQLLESGAQAGAWEISAQALSVGWLRLSLAQALDDDEQSVFAEISWEGTGQLLLGAGLYHPDPDYCTTLAQDRTDRMLAHRIWKYLPGARAPLPADGYWTLTPEHGRIYIDPEHLSRAVPVGPDTNCLQYFKALEALQVHPRKKAISAGILPGAVAAGVRQVSAVIGSRSEQASEIEYALALAPRHPARETGDLVAAAERSRMISDWVCLSGDCQGDVTLILPAPAEQTYNLVLLTRLAPRGQPAYGWATFRDIWMSG